MLPETASDEDIRQRYLKLANMIHPIDIVYQCRLGWLYPDLDENMDIRDWRNELIHRLANDKAIYMEENEPMCIHKVPREGIVIRKNNDVLKEAFKLKTMKFRNKEAKEYDAGNVDIEASQGYAPYPGEWVCNGKGDPMYPIVNGQVVKK